MNSKRPSTTSRYAARGVTGKAAVHAAVGALDKGLFPGAFCKILPDHLGRNKNRCIIMHADGSGSKLTLAYLVWKHTGDITVWDGIVQDSMVMNLDDAACVGATGPFIVSSTLGRNTFNVPDEVVQRLILGTSEFCEKMSKLGIACHLAGGETADLPNQTATAIIDHTVFTTMMRKDVIDASQIGIGNVLVGFSSTGQAAWETSPNAGMGSNGLTNAIHDLLHRKYRKDHETFGWEVPQDQIFAGNYELNDPMPGDDRFTIARALLSPTRTYLPLVKRVLKEIGGRYVKGMIHCSGGGQTKIGHFGAEGIEIVKDNLFPTPPLFELLMKERELPLREALSAYNMGHRFEIGFLDTNVAEEAIELASELGIDARIIGPPIREAKGLHGGKKRRVTIKTREETERYEF